MNALSHLAPSESIAWLAVNSVLLVTAVIAVAYAAATLFARRHAALRSSIWTAALACVLVSPVAAYVSVRSDFSLIAIPWPTRDNFVESVTRRESPAPAAPTEVSSETHFTPPHEFVPEDAPPGLVDTDHADVDAIGSAMETVRESPQAPPAASIAPPGVGQALAGLASILWMMGTLYLLARLCIGWVTLLRRSGAARPALREKIKAALAETTSLLNGRRLPTVMISEQIKAPLAVGIVRPVVLIPTALVASASDDQLRAILLHEFAHHFRHDLLACVLQRLATALFWPHPLIWVLNRELTRAREEACDNFALQAIPAPTFARILLQLTETLTARPEPQAALGLGSTWNLEDRVAGLLDKKRNIAMRASHLSRGLVVTLLVAASTPVAGVRFVGADSAPKDENATTAAKQYAATAPNKTTPPKTPPKETKASLELVVVDAKTNAPVPNTRVVVSGGETVIFTTDERGRTTLKPLDDMGFGLGFDVQGPGFVPQRFSFRKQDSLPKELTVRLLPGTSMSGLIQDEAGRPIAGATIYLWGHKYTSRVPEEIFFDVPAVTDASGRWQCDSVPADVKTLSVRLTHPEYIEDDLYGRRPVSDNDFQKFRDGSIVHVMKKGVTVTGRVLDPDGKPLPGVIVSPAHDALLYIDRQRISTDGQGRFRFTGMAPGEFTVITEADGYALGMGTVTASDDTPPMEIHLERAHPFHGRVVNHAGKPIADAFVNIDMWQGYRSFKSGMRTDKEGHFEWKQAPAGSFLVNVSATGYTSIFRKPMKPSPSEQVITLGASLTVQGVVIDANTGKSIPKFTIIHETASNQGWGKGQYESRKFTNGKFEFAIERDLPDNMLRVEADGYTPAVSRSFATAEGKVTLDFQLEPSEGPRGVLHLPNGAPATGATVALYSMTMRLSIDEGKPKPRQTLENPTATTDARGAFRLPPQAERYFVAAIHKQGFADVSDTQLSKAPTITLQPWGRIEGVAQIGDKPAAGYQVMYQLVDPDSLLMAYSTVVADASGRFQIDRVPPAEVQIYLTAPKGSASRFHRIVHFQRIKPGESVNLKLGGGGTTVKGRLTAPDSSMSHIDFVGAHSCSIREAAHHDLLDKGRASKDPKWFDRLLQSPEQRAIRYGSKTAYFGVGPDGAFEIPDVAPGEYILSVELPRKGQPPVQGCGMQSMASLKRRFRVSERKDADASSPVDLGELPLQLLNQLAPGDVAPDFALPSGEEKPLRLADYRGKFVLLHFWASWCAPCVAEMPVYQKLQTELGKDSRFVIVGISFDNDEKDFRDLLKRSHSPLNEAFAGAFSKATIDDDYGVSTIPDAFLIGPDGKIIAAHLTKSNVEAEVAKALAK